MCCFTFKKSDHCGKSSIQTTFEEKHAATLVSSVFQATSKISPLPLKLLMCLPSSTFQMYNCPASEPLARYIPDGEKATEYTESRCLENTCIHVPSWTFHKRTDPSNEAVANSGFLSGLLDPGPVGALQKEISLVENK